MQLVVAGETMDIEDEISANQAEVLAQFERRKRVSKLNFYFQYGNSMFFKVILQFFRSRFTVLSIL